MAQRAWQDTFKNILEESTLGSPRFEGAIAFKQQHLPRRIYKYRRDCPESRDCLEASSLWMASPDSYNDPYDCSIMLLLVFETWARKHSARWMRSLGQFAEFVLSCNSFEVQ